MSDFHVGDMIRSVSGMYTGRRGVITAITTKYTLTLATVKLNGTSKRVVKNTNRLERVFPPHLRMDKGL